MLIQRPAARESPKAMEPPAVSRFLLPSHDYSEEKTKVSATESLTSVSDGGTFPTPCFCTRCCKLLKTTDYGTASFRLRTLKIVEVGGPSREEPTTKSSTMCGIASDSDFNALTRT